MASLLIDMVRRGGFPDGSCRAAHNPANQSSHRGPERTKPRWLLARHSKAASQPQAPGGGEVPAELLRKCRHDETVMVIAV
jgi:hypothetical protein